MEVKQEETSITLSVPVAKLVEDPETMGEDFPYQEHGMRLEVAASGARKVYVGSAPQPLMRHNRSVLLKLAKGKVVTKEQAEELVYGYTIHNAENGRYECTLCEGKVHKHKSYLIQRHLYDHFNLYFLRCDQCHDIFRFATQFKEHQEAHRKQEQRQQEEQEKQKATQEQEVLGSYHLADKFTFLPPSEARRFVESCYRSQESDVGKEVECKLCGHRGESGSRMYSHCLKHHLKINQYKCDLCEVETQTEQDIKRHYRRVHGQRLEVVRGVTEEGGEGEESYESLETDLPGLEDLGCLPLEQLRGKKVSTRQAKTIKGRYMLHNEETGLHECELCDYKRRWRGNLQFHVLGTHYQVCYCRHYSQTLVKPKYLNLGGPMCALP